MTTGTHDRSVAVIGIGNPFRADDGAGPAVVRLVAPRLPHGVLVREVDGEAARLLDAWSGAAAVVLIDAVCSGSPPGTVHHHDLGGGDDLPAWQPGTSTHGAGLAAAVGLAKALDRLPSRLVLFGIEAATFDEGQPLSAPVSAAVAEVAERVVAVVEAMAVTSA